MPAPICRPEALKVGVGARMGGSGGGGPTAICAGTGDGGGAGGSGGGAGSGCRPDVAVGVDMSNCQSNIRPQQRDTKRRWFKNSAPFQASSRIAVSAPLAPSVVAVDVASIRRSARHGPKWPSRCRRWPTAACSA